VNFDVLAAGTSAALVDVMKAPSYCKLCLVSLGSLLAASGFLAFVSAGVARAADADPQDEASADPQDTGARVVARARTTAYHLEIEPHLSVGASDLHANSEYGVGYGGGVRIGIPFVHGYIDRSPQNLALTLGGDFLHYDSCQFGMQCVHPYVANYVVAPAALQWNVGVARSISLFLEVGAFLYKGWVSQCAPGDTSCVVPPDFGVLPTAAIGGRLHITNDVAATLRLGYPATTLGVSFM
jgi:hypothetical protein